jgi:hypothetical protein
MKKKNVVGVVKKAKVIIDMRNVLRGMLFRLKRPLKDFFGSWKIDFTFHKGLLNFTT